MCTLLMLKRLLSWSFLQTFLPSPKTGALLAGDEIPDFTNNQLPLATLWENQPYALAASDHERILRIEVEDEGGNLAVREFTVLV